MRPIVGGIFRFMFLVLFMTCTRFSLANGLANSTSSVDDIDMVPVMEPGKVETMMMMMVNGSRRKLGSFQICALCTCCGGGGKTYCLASPCCYAINCNIPNRPFGFCSFTPKTCNCFRCHL
ncbi:hypothetical protein ABFS83_06G205400 [Erythranthe nasuta]